MNLHHPRHRPLTLAPPPSLIPILFTIAGIILYAIWLSPKLFYLASLPCNEAVFHANCLVICYAFYKAFRFFKGCPEDEHLEHDQGNETQPLETGSIAEFPSPDVKERFEEPVPVQSDDQDETQPDDAEEVVIHPTGDITIVVSPPETLQFYAQENTTTQPRRFRVSSRHLMRRSRYFEILLTSLFVEENELFKNGTMELCILGADPDTFSVLLRLLHSQPPPRQTSLLATFPQFIDLAVQADCFECEEVLRDYPQKWLQAHCLQDPISADSVDATWVFVAWMYRDAELFAKVTRIIQRQRRGDFDTLGLPIPEAIESAINDTKKEAIAGIIDIFSARLADLQGDEFHCSHMCDSFKLGSLVRQLRAASIYLVEINSSQHCDNHSVEEFLELLGQMKDYDCISRDPNGRLCNPSGVCDASWKDTVSKRLEDYTQTPNGLTLQDFVDCQRREDWY